MDGVEFISSQQSHIIIAIYTTKSSTWKTTELFLFPNSGGSQQCTYQMLF